MTSEKSKAIHTIGPYSFTRVKITPKVFFNSSFCGSAWTELKMWCAIVVNRGLTTRVKGEQRECTVCTVVKEVWVRCETGEVTVSTYWVRTVVSQYRSLFGIVESGPSDVELQGGSSIAVAAVSKDRLDDELLLIVLSYSQRISADGS